MKNNKLKDASNQGRVIADSLALRHDRLFKFLGYYTFTYRILGERQYNGIFPTHRTCPNVTAARLDLE